MHTFIGKSIFSAPFKAGKLTAKLVAAGLLGFSSQILLAAPSLFDNTLQVETVVSTNLSAPLGMAFLGNDDFFVIEKASGKVKRVVGGTVTATVLDLPVNSNSERGLLGIALHPNFPTNPSVYVFWTESSTGADSTVALEVGNPGTSQGYAYGTGTPQPLGNRVDRFTWDSNNQTLTWAANIIKLHAYQNDYNNALQPTTATPAGNHNSGQIRFGQDGKLHIQIGDNGRRGWLQNLTNGPYLALPQAPTLASLPVDDEFGGPQPDNNHLTGAILRLNDDGTTPSDNPFYAAGAAIGGEVGSNIQKLFSYGHRNGYGLAFDPYTGKLWESENGDDSFDEINQVQAGGNYGWIQTMGPLSRMSQFKTIEMNLYNPANAPIGATQQLRYPVSRIAYSGTLGASRMYMLPGATYHDPELSWRYGMPPSGLGFVNGNGLGAANAGTLWSGEARNTNVTGGTNGTVAGGWLMRFKLNNARDHLDLSADPRLSDRVADNGVSYPPPKGTINNQTTGTYKFNGIESETLFVGQNFGVLGDIQTGPDGYLYLVSNTLNAVYRIKPAP